MASAENYHTFKASGQQFEIPSRYKLIRPIGHGAYGVVISAHDEKSNKNVAIKKIRRAFDDRVDAKRILREIKLMKRLEHENVIRIIDLIPPPPNAEEFEDVYIVQELMETDLHRIIHSRQSLTIDHVQYFIYQILRGLKFIHSSNVLHRDLKPYNLLLNSNCD
jgi:mitogen-activated protein kinase 1/3